MVLKISQRMTLTRFLFAVVSCAFALHSSTWVRKDPVGVNALLAGSRVMYTSSILYHSQTWLNPKPSRHPLTRLDSSEPLNTRNDQPAPAGPVDNSLCGKACHANEQCWLWYMTMSQPVFSCKRISMTTDNTVAPVPALSSCEEPFICDIPMEQAYCNREGVRCGPDEQCHFNGGETDEAHYGFYCKKRETAGKNESSVRA